MKLISIGFSNLIAEQRLVAVFSPDSAPIKRAVQEARERGKLIDASYGRRTRSVLLMDSDYFILSALPPERLANRVSGEEYKETEQGDTGQEEVP